MTTQHQHLEDYPRSEWGPIFWYILHRFSQSYQPEFSTYYYNLITQYPLLVPCPICSYHFEETLKRSHPKTDSQDSLFDWGVNVHNVVNKRLRKKILSIEEAYKIYSKQVDNKVIIRFLEYLSEFLAIDSNIYRINATIVALESVSFAYPCEKCREKLVQLNENHSIGVKNIRLYIEKMIKILGEC